MRATEAIDVRGVFCCSVARAGWLSLTNSSTIIPNLSTDSVNQGTRNGGVSQNRIVLGLAVARMLLVITTCHGLCNGPPITRVDLTMVEFSGFPFKFIDDPY